MMADLESLLSQFLPAVIPYQVLPPDRMPPGILKNVQCANIKNGVGLVGMIRGIVRIKRGS